jgi:hypothetical protein
MTSVNDLGSWPYLSMARLWSRSCSATFSGLLSVSLDTACLFPDHLGQCPGHDTCIYGQEAHAQQVKTLDGLRQDLLYGTAKEI